MKMKKLILLVTLSFTLMTTTHAQIMRGDGGGDSDSGARYRNNTPGQTSSPPAYDPWKNTRGTNYNDSPGSRGEGGTDIQAAKMRTQSRSAQQNTQCNPSQSNCCPTTYDVCSQQLIGAQCNVNSAQKGTCRLMPQGYNASCFCSANQVTR